MSAIKVPAATAASACEITISAVVPAPGGLIEAFNTSTCSTVTFAVFRSAPPPRVNERFPVPVALVATTLY